MRSILIIFIIMVSCQSPSQKIAKIMENTIGRNIQIPKYPYANIDGEVSISDSLFSGIKMIIYTPELLCTSCNIDKILEWKSMLRKLKGDTNLNFVFIFTPSDDRDMNELMLTLKLNRFNYPVFYDMAHEYIKKNKFMNIPLLYVCLLDHNNKIILVGDPRDNESLLQLYRKHIVALSNL